MRDVESSVTSPQAPVLRLRIWLKPKVPQLKPRCGSTIHTSLKRQRGTAFPSLALFEVALLFKPKGPQLKTEVWKHHLYKPEAPARDSFSLAGTSGLYRVFRITTIKSATSKLALWRFGLVSNQTAQSIIQGILAEPCDSCVESITLLPAKRR